LEQFLNTLPQYSQVSFRTRVLPTILVPGVPLKVLIACCRYGRLPVTVVAVDPGKLVVIDPLLLFREVFKELFRENDPPLVFAPENKLALGEAFDETALAALAAFPANDGNQKPAYNCCCCSNSRRNRLAESTADCGDVNDDELRDAPVGESPVKLVAVLFSAMPVELLNCDEQDPGRSKRSPELLVDETAAEAAELNCSNACLYACKY
jgi:hypothetical protein